MSWRYKKEVYVKDFSKHPNVVVELESSPKSNSAKSNSDKPKPKLTSSACGRYQFLSKTWKGLDLPSFKPYWQDVGAIMLMERRKAINPLLRRQRPTEDDLAEALERLSWKWASLPSGRNNAGRYGQPSRTFQEVVRLYYQFLGR